MSILKEFFASWRPPACQRTLLADIYDSKGVPFNEVINQNNIEDEGHPFLKSRVMVQKSRGALNLYSGGELGHVSFEHVTFIK